MFWQKLTQLCANKNISPNKVCADLGFSTAVATKWKKGSTPRSTTLQQIADYFNVSVSYFETKEKSPSESSEGLKESDRMILEKVSTLTEAKKQQALEYLDFLLSKH